MENKELIRVLAIIAGLIIGVLVGWGLMSFILWDASPGNWSMVERTMIVFAAVICGILSQIFVE